MYRNSCWLRHCHGHEHDDEIAVENEYVDEDNAEADADAEGEGDVILWDACSQSHVNLSGGQLLLLMSVC